MALPDVEDATRRLRLEEVPRFMGCSMNFDHRKERDTRRFECD